MVQVDAVRSKEEGLVRSVGGLVSPLLAEENNSPGDRLGWTFYYKEEGSDERSDDGSDAHRLEKRQNRRRNRRIKSKEQPVSG